MKKYIHIVFLFLLQNFATAQEVELRNATTINTSNLEFSPTFYQNGIVFASSRFKAGSKDEKIDETFFELFYSELDANGEPLKARPFSMHINSVLHEGPVTFNRKGDQIFFTRNNFKKGLQKADSKGVTRLKIYQATKGATDWENIQELPFNHDEFSCAHPTLSADGKTLYFSSDRPGGQGGMDIWKSEKKGEEWGNPINLGEKINTAEHDVFPFVHSSGTLFFASQGHDGEGGLDMFVVNLNHKNSKVLNLGEPFNSKEDDLGLILSRNGKNGFFASNRQGGTGKDDIYQFKTPEGIFGWTANQLYASTITVFDETTDELIADAEIRIFEKDKNGFLHEGENLLESVLMPKGESNDELFFKLIQKDATQLGAADRISNEIGEATFDFYGEREYLIVVFKEGYAKKEMIYSTLGNSILEEIWIGLSKPVCVNVKGVVKNKSTHERLPQSIVSIINETTGEQFEIFSNEKAEFEFCAKTNCDYRVQGVRENFLSDFIQIASNDLLTGEQEIEIFMTPNYKGLSLGAGTIIVLENIFYDFDKSAIRVGAARELEELVFLMQKYPSMFIELASHTDSRGDNNYNLTLSQARAESAKSFLIARGIAAERIRAIGFGEVQPRNICKDGVHCSEEEHQYNRRTEVKVISIEAPVNIRYGNNAPMIIDEK